MKQLLAGSIASLIVTNAFAQAPSLNESNSSPRISPMEVRAPPAYAATRAMYHRVRGTYDLSDGTTMHITREGRHFFIDIDGHPRAEVIATGGDTFAALNGTATLTFRSLPNGVLSHLELARRSEMQTAVQTTRIELAMR